MMMNDVRIYVRVIIDVVVDITYESSLVGLVAVTHTIITYTTITW